MLIGKRMEKFAKNTYLRTENVTSYIYILKLVCLNPRNILYETFAECSGTPCIFIISDIYQG